jgi:hypothetical protein
MKMKKWGRTRMSGFEGSQAVLVHPSGSKDRLDMR